jgi:hypothetical protein
VLDATRLRTAMLAPLSARSTRISGKLIRTIVSIAIASAAFLTAAWFGATPPFEGRTADPYSERAVLNALPFDTPLPYDMSLVTAGRGEDLPYQLQWTSSLPPSEIAGQFREHLAGSPKWNLTQEPPTADEFVTTVARIGADGYMTHFASIAISHEADQTIVSFSFTPIPSALAPD